MKKYILLTFVLTFILVFSFSNTSYASDSLPDFSDKITKVDGSEYLYILNCQNYQSENDEDKTYNLIVSRNNSKPVQLREFISNYNFYYQGSEYYNSYPFYVYSYKIGDEGWTLTSSSGSVYIGVPLSDYDENSSYAYAILASNYDLVYNGTTVFRQAPTLAGAIIPRMTILEQIVKQAGYLIPCLIGFLVGLVAFRKGWIWLKMQLLGL